MRLQPRRFALAVSIAVASATFGYDAPPEPNTLLRRIAFGSCNSPLDATPIWESIAATSPDLWLWLGDTVYADTPRPTGATPQERSRQVLAQLVSLYGRQRALPEYQRLRSGTRVLGTWDDHDYGLNDAGADFVGRDESQRHFMDFYDEPADSPRRKQPGVYASYRFGPPGRVVQIVVLDTRYFRSPLQRAPEGPVPEGIRGPYVPSDDASATVLGEAQWRWLEATLRQPADVRLIVTSIQVVANDHRFEKWGNFPHERRRLLALLRATGAQGVVFLSGDRHTGELSRLDPAREPDGAAIDPGYPLFDLTSSAMTKSRPTAYAEQTERRAKAPISYFNEINRHRVGSPLAYNHFGLLTLNWEAAGGAELTLALHTDRGAEVLRQRVPLAALRRK